MEQLIGILHIAALLVAVAGVAKIVSPQATSAALSETALPSSIVPVRALGTAEVALGVATIAVGGTALPALLGLVYLGFAVFVGQRLRAEPSAGCGCFGRAEAPLTTGHVVANGAAAVIGALFAITGAPTLSSVLSEQPWAGVPYLLLLAVGTFFAVAVLTVLPAARAARRPTDTPTEFRLQAQP